MRVVRRSFLVKVKHNIRIVDREVVMGYHVIRLNGAVWTILNKKAWVVERYGMTYRLQWMSPKVGMMHSLSTCKQCPLIFIAD